MTKKSGSQMLRLDADLWNRIGKLAERTGKTPRQEIESRLEQSLLKTPGDNLSPALALGRVIELHSDDVAGYSQSAEEWRQEMTASVPALVSELFGLGDQITQARDQSFAVGAARTLAQKIRRAHLPTARTGDPIADHWANEADRYAAQQQPSLGRLHQEELLKIQKALGLSPATAAPSKARLRTKPKS
jgi:hypothetical protein